MGALSAEGRLSRLLRWNRSSWKEEMPLFENAVGSSTKCNSFDMVIIMISSRLMETIYID